MFDFKWAILIFLAIVVVVIMYKHAIFSKQLDGVWTATPEFCAMADLSNMVIVVSGSTFSKEMLITMYKDDEMIFSKDYNITLIPDFMPGIEGASIGISGKVDVMPTSPRITLNSSCRLVIGNDDKKYFEGIRY